MNYLNEDLAADAFDEEEQEFLDPSEGSHGSANYYQCMMMIDELDEALGDLSAVDFEEVSRIWPTLVKKIFEDSQEELKNKEQADVVRTLRRVLIDKWSVLNSTYPLL